MRVISISLDGITQAVDRGFLDWLSEQDADIVCLQDLKVREYQLPEAILYPEGYYAYFLDSADGNYGVGILTKFVPKAIMTGLNFNNELDYEGRYIQADFEHFSVASILAPGDIEGNDSKNKQLFFESLKTHFSKISNKRREYIFCGNFNAAHKEVDVRNWKKYENSPGFLPRERYRMDELFCQLGYVDAFREVQKDSDEYSWWPSGEIEKGDGWRVDYQVVSSGLKKNVDYGAIFRSKQFSSHLPVIIDYDIENLIPVLDEEIY